ncbi:hypothetical protein K458DRAFT_381552 [Lentithecium fluviatile CBS 122367]|uniref:Uncharacterized protein n=1 Tax=Lentithecium fluviatile CBS 122367 TaxID=1168545 RepID=A0A6G1JNA7_9PLEO|nr:hypothetical protein K458DRAFT_381552 [Lentithecium fluviatile CBS 122367]
MTLKRKRSCDSSPVSVSSFGGVATPEAHSPTPFPHNFDGAMDLDSCAHRGTGWDFSSIGRVKGSEWGLRTRKRVRDNRPEERVIHENTISKLFSAQRKHPHAEPIMSDALPSQSTTIVQRLTQKSTLHTFWKLPAPPVQPPAFPIPQQHMSNTPRCEDCDATLQQDVNAIDVDMEVDGPMERSPFACDDCGRAVCGTCAVVACRRHCLGCATSARNSRRWW